MYNLYRRKVPLSLLFHFERAAGGYSTNPSDKLSVQRSILAFSSPNKQDIMTKRKPQSISEIKRLQNYVKDYTNTKGKSLKQELVQYAERDEEFNNFLQEFKSKEGKQWKNVMDLTQESWRDRLLEKGDEYREDELQMLGEFRKRKSLRNYYDLMQEHEQMSPPDARKFPEDPYRLEKRLQQETEYQDKTSFRPNVLANEIYNPADFTMIFLDADFTTNITFQKRVQSRRVLIFMGNQNGVIGYGKGKGSDYQDAYNHSFRDAKNNLIALRLDSFVNPQNTVMARFNDVKMKIRAQRWHNPWGNPIIWQMLLHSGMKNTQFKVIGRKPNPYALVYCFFMCMTQIKNSKDIAELRGTKTYQLTYGNVDHPNTPNYNSLVLP